MKSHDWRMYRKGAVSHDWKCRNCGARVSSTKEPGEHLSGSYSDVTFFLANGDEPDAEVRCSIHADCDMYHVREVMKG